MPNVLTDIASDELPVFGRSRSRLCPQYKLTLNTTFGQSQSREFIHTENSWNTDKFISKSIKEQNFS